MRMHIFARTSRDVVYAIETGCTYYTQGFWYYARPVSEEGDWIVVKMSVEADRKEMKNFKKISKIVLHARYIAEAIRDINVFESGKRVPLKPAQLARRAEQAFRSVDEMLAHKAYIEARVLADYLEYRQGMGFDE